MSSGNRRMIRQRTMLPFVSLLILLNIVIMFVFLARRTSIAVVVTTTTTNTAAAALFETTTSRQQEQPATRSLKQQQKQHVVRQTNHTGNAEHRPVVSIAYAISVTSCSFPNSTNVFDGAAVLAHSIHQQQSRSRYYYHDYVLYAFVHSSVERPCVERLQQIGYRVLVKDTPFRVQDIRNEHLRKAITESGCCGEKEFLKLYAYTLEQHAIAVHMDLDTLVLQPLDELFDAMSGVVPLSEPISVMRNASLPDKVDFFFTRDYIAKSTYHTDWSKYAVQGGFFVVRTNRTLYQEMVETILDGADFTRHGGYGNKGYAGYWGAYQIQGFLSYFYGQLYPHTAVELNRCVYNTMAKDDPYLADGKTCRTGESICQDCRVIPVESIKTAHLTTCWKPYQCPQLPKRKNPHLCSALHRAWFGLRQSLERQLGLNVPADDDKAYNYKRYFGYCKKLDVKKYGKKAVYLPMNLAARALP